MIDRAKDHVRKATPFLREDTATVAAFSAASGAYTLTYRGATVGPVWSAGGVLYRVGDVVKVLVDGTLVKQVIP